MDASLLKSWNPDVSRATREASVDYVRPTARIATFDSEGALRCERLQLTNVDSAVASMRNNEKAVFAEVT